MTYHTLTRDAVRTVATSLMALHGTTTTLDVKRHLRSRGYWARQADVSAYMHRLAVAERWSVRSNGRFRRYALPPAPSPPHGASLFVVGLN